MESADQAIEISHFPNLADLAQAANSLTEQNLMIAMVRRTLEKADMRCQRFKHPDHFFGDSHASAQTQMSASKFP